VEVPGDSESVVDESEDDAPQPTELIIGLVTPIGTQTGILAERIERMLSDCGYTAVVIRLSDLLPNGAPARVGETGDQRIKRLITAGNDFCDQNNDPAAIARLAVKDIREKRLTLFRQDNDQRPTEELIKAPRPRTAYILHSLKRPDEVELLREIYADQFILVGSQGSYAQRLENLFGRNLSPTTSEGKRELAEELIRVDAKENNERGQNVNETFPQADFFLNNDEKDVDRFIGLLFGEPLEPTIGEFAMYVARASSARSLAFSRKVGAAIVVDDAVISTGYNEVPQGQTTDVRQSADTSEQFKKSNLIDTLRRLKQAELLSEGLTEIDAATIQKAEAAQRRRTDGSNRVPTPRARRSEGD
jgi:cytidine deaminase